MLHVALPTALRAADGSKGGLTNIYLGLNHLRWIGCMQMSTRGLWLAVCKWVRTGVRNCSGKNNLAGGGTCELTRKKSSHLQAGVLHEGSHLNYCLFATNFNPFEGSSTIPGGGGAPPDFCSGGAAAPWTSPAPRGLIPPRTFWQSK